MLNGMNKSCEYSGVSFWFTRLVHDIKVIPRKSVTELGGTCVEFRPTVVIILTARFCSLTCRPSRYLDPPTQGRSS